MSSRPATARELGDVLRCIALALEAIRRMPEPQRGQVLEAAIEELTVESDRLRGQ